MTRNVGIYMATNVGYEQGNGRFGVDRECISIKWPRESLGTCNERPWEATEAQGGASKSPWRPRQRESAGGVV